MRVNLGRVVFASLERVAVAASRMADEIGPWKASRERRCCPCKGDGADLLPPIVGQHDIDQLPPRPVLFHHPSCRDYGLGRVRKAWMVVLLSVRKGAARCSIRRMYDQPGSEKPL